MRALTLSQPWATIVAAGLKSIENRKWPLWPALYGELFAIHAGAKFDDDGDIWIGSNFQGNAAVLAELRQGFRHGYRHGMILGVARAMGNIVKATGRYEGDATSWDLDSLRASPWFFGPHGFVLEDVQQLREPVPCKGALGFWTLPPHVEALVNAQWSPRVAGQ
jgi:hypothetical protein